MQHKWKDGALQTEWIYRNTVKHTLQRGMWVNQEFKINMIFIELFSSDSAKG